MIAKLIWKKTAVILLLHDFKEIFNYKLQKQAYNFQKGLLEEQMGRQRHEWARQDRNRANITNAWNNGKSYSNSLAGSGINNNTQVA